MPCIVPIRMGVPIPWRRLSLLGVSLLALVGAGADVVVSDASGARKTTAVQLVTRDAIVATGRAFDLDLRCPGSALSCEGKITVRELRPVAKPAADTATGAARKKRRKLVLARGEAVLDGGVATVVELTLSKKGFKRVRRHGPLVARVVMTGRDATGRKVRLRRKVRLGVPVRVKPSLLVGIADDRIQGTPDRTAQTIRDLGLRSVRVLFLWQPGQSALAPAQTATLAGIVSSAPDLRIVLSARSRTGSETPTSAAERDAYCSFVGDVATRFPSINDFATLRDGAWHRATTQRCSPVAGMCFTAFVRMPT